MSLIQGRTPFLKLNLIDYDRVGWSVPDQENMYILDSVFGQFSQFHNIRGLWRGATNYNARDVVIDPSTGSMWEATVPHTSTSDVSFAQERELNPSLWFLATGGVVTEVSGATVSPEQFGATGDGGADDTGAIQSMMSFAIANRKSISGGGIYRVTAPIDVNVFDTQVLDIKSLHVFSDVDGEVSTLRITVPPTGIYDVQQLDDVVLNLSNDLPPSAQSFPCVRVRLPAGHSVTKDALCKLVCDDPIPQQDGEPRFKGEGVYIVHVDGNDVYTSARLRNSFGTNTRLVHYNKNARVSLNNLYFESDLQTNIDNARRVTYLRIKGAVAPSITQFRARRVTSVALLLQSCIGPFLSHCYIHAGRNLPDSLIIPGYGIQDTGCEFGIYNVIHGQNLRHTFTTVAATTDVDDVFTYGESYGFIVANSSDFASSSAGFDTHAGSQSGCFYNIVTSSPYIGESSAQSGIQLRGGKHYIANHQHTGGGNGITLHKDYAGVLGDHIIDNAKYSGNGNAIRSSNNVFGGLRFTVKGLVARCSGSQGVRVGNCEATFIAPDVEMAGGSGQACFHSTGDTALYILPGGAFRVSDGSDARIVTYNGRIVCELDGRVLNYTTNWDSAVRSLDGTPRDDSFIRVNLIADLFPFAKYNGLANNGASDVGSFIRAAGPSRTTSAIVEITVSTGNNTINPEDSLAPVIFRRINCLTTGCEINSILPGLFSGQKMVLFNKGTSTQSFTVIHNHSGGIDLAATITVSPFSAIEMVWNDFQWVTVSGAVSVSGGTGVTDHGALTGLSDDDHSIYHTDARANTWLGTKPLTSLSGVPALVANRFLGTTPGNALTWQPNPMTQKLLDLDSLLDVLFFFDQVSTQPRFQIKNASAQIKHEFSELYSVIGGSLSDRVGPEVLTVVGSARFTQGLEAASVVGDYQNTALIGDIFLWNDGAGSLRFKRTTAPTSATDGTVLGGSPISRAFQAADAVANSATYVAGPSIAYTAGTWRFLFYLMISSSDAANGLSSRTNVVGGSPLISGVARTIAGTNGNTAEWQGTLVNSGQGYNTINFPNATSYNLSIQEGIVVATGAGTLSFEFRPEITDGTMSNTLRAGSFVEIEKLKD